jgi:hypothetical protein
LQYDLAGTVTLEPFVGDGRRGDIATELLEFFTLIDGCSIFCRGRPMCRPERAHTQVRPYKRTQLKGAGYFFPKKLTVPGLIHAS